jgi:predicted CXXCH cytochrome family protein
MVIGKLFIFTLLLTLLPAVRSVAENPHTEAASCRLKFEEVVENSACWYVCTECHKPAPTIHPLNIYEDGDSIICLRCHESKSYRDRNNLLLKLVPGAGGNHPVEILYDPERPRSELKLNPRGPLLFMDADGRNPKVMCSTCHNPMGSNSLLLWVTKGGSGLCMACHDK